MSKISSRLSSSLSMPIITGKNLDDNVVTSAFTKFWSKFGEMKTRKEVL